MAFEREKNKMLDAAPEYISVLIGADYFHCEVSDYADDPPAIAWTMFDKERKRWQINFRPEAANMSYAAREALWRHEVGHIAFAHFGKQMCNPEDPIRSRAEQIEVGDVQVNTYLLERPELLDEVGAAAKRLVERLTGEPQPDEHPGYLDPRVILPEIGLSVQPYSFEIIHAYLHQKMDEDGQGNWTEQLKNALCAGITNGEGIEPGDGAELTAGLVSAMSDWGSDPAMGSIRLRESNLPPWIDALEAFARSIIEVVMADTRSHTRPQEIYKAYDVHMPTMRPRWAYKADQVCFLIDTSGSMYGQLQYVMPVVQYLTQHNISCRIIAGDTRVTLDELIKPGIPLPTGIVGGGGTEITPLFDRAMEYSPRSIVLFSDAFVPRWPKNEGIPTLIVGAQAEVPEWMTKA